jgi:hypothetical protein
MGMDVVKKFYSGYGDLISSFNGTGPDHHQRLVSEGNEYAKCAMFLSKKPKPHSSAPLFVALTQPELDIGALSFHQLLKALFYYKSVARAKLNVSDFPHPCDLFNCAQKGAP